MQKGYYESLSENVPPHLLHGGRNVNINRVILLLLEKYFSGVTLPPTLKISKEILEYYSKTRNMMSLGLILDDIDAEYVYAILSNLMLVAANINRQPPKGKKESAEPMPFNLPKWDDTFFPDLIVKQRKINLKNNPVAPTVSKPDARPPINFKFPFPMNKPNEVSAEAKTAEQEWQEVQYLKGIFMITKERLEEDFNGWD